MKFGISNETYQQGIVGDTLELTDSDLEAVRGGEGGGHHHHGDHDGFGFNLLGNLFGYGGPSYYPVPTPAYYPAPAPSYYPVPTPSYYPAPAPSYYPVPYGVPAPCGY